MGMSVLHIKTEVECKVFLYGEEKGIATPGTYFDIEVRTGEQDLLFVSTEYYIVQCNLLFLVEESDRDYRIVLDKSSFRSLTISSDKDSIDDECFIAYSTDGKHLIRRKVYDYLDDYDKSSIVKNEDKIIVTNPKGETVNINDVKSVSRKKYYHVKDGCEIIDDWAFCDHGRFSCEVDYYDYYRFCDRYGYNNIEEITFPNSLKYIGDGAFSHTPLKRIDLPPKLKHIGRRAFYGCDELSVVSIPFGITYIGSCAFSHCTKLSKIFLPSSIREVGYNAFDDRTLTQIYIMRGDRKYFENLLTWEWHSKLTEINCGQAVPNENTTLSVPPQESFFSLREFADLKGMPTNAGQLPLKDSEGNNFKAQGMSFGTTFVTYSPQIIDEHPEENAYCIAKYILTHSSDYEITQKTEWSTMNDNPVFIICHVKMADG